LDASPAPVLVLFGPTASGKTNVLLRFLGDSGIFGCPAEVVSADSMQVYRGMDIGTAKPSAQERERLPHHLIDIRNPDEQFNAGDFVRLALEAIAGIAQRGAFPVVCGGTGFYLKNLILGLPESPPADAEIRAALKGELREKGAAALMRELAAGDPASAGRIHLNDTYRLLRALEVLRLTGRPLSSFGVPGQKSISQNLTQRHKDTKDGAGFSRHAQNFVPRTEGSTCLCEMKLGNGQNSEINCRFILIGLSRPREELYRRIDARCAAMFAQGLPDEVRRLYDMGYTPRDPGLRAIGYREFFVQDEDAGSSEPPYRLSRDIPGIQALVAQNSRRYAKRQITFFSSLPGVQWLEAGDDDAETAGRLREIIEKKNLTQRHKGTEDEKLKMKN
jgi:tRNA dimethylallyltransferase